MSVMKTVNEMMEAARKYQALTTTAPVFEKAFCEIEKMLRPDEDVLFAFTGSSAVRKNNSMLFAVGVALTNQRLLIGGQIKGFLKVSYSGPSYSITYRMGGKIIRCVQLRFFRSSCMGN